ncbi:family 76 glycoside hydrolase [Mollisia scopiformis]|uniref:mannan endo-1,6-alpha-mannosidase n=1 Tax=Mollisia scopiformis TaxID=149040 RepID=A0A194WWW8_MOLSC|nr:family 76 glycoside hydrolase [Mollisia scopiformis]KUJ12476.1 family 76 glycoside hydrolase [Mollisia scopiformis]
MKLSFPLSVFSLLPLNLARQPTSKTDYTQASTEVLSKLMEYYHASPNVTAGLFDQSISPWWESGSIFETYMDYAKYAASNQFAVQVGEALVINSYDQAHDFFGTNHSYVSLVVGRWNDDVEWYAQAVAAGGELYGPESFMPGLSRRGNGTWISLVQRTIEEVYSYHTSDCGGGIYWSTDPSQYPTYKSGITQLGFISLASRAYLMTRNETLLAITEELFNWVVSSGMVNLTSGWVGDGVDTTGCAVHTDQWSYSYGQLLGGLSFLYRATGNTSYLEYTKPILATAISTFAPDGIATELCEADGSCNQDQQGFKAIFLRQLAYLYRTTEDTAVKDSIAAVVTQSATAALATCDGYWNCTGGWTAKTVDYPAFRSTHLVAAALVAAEGISR